MADKFWPADLVKLKIPKLDPELVGEYGSLIRGTSSVTPPDTTPDPKLFPESREKEIPNEPHEKVSRARGLMLATKLHDLAEQAWRQALERDPSLAQKWKQYCLASLKAADEFTVGMMMLAMAYSQAVTDEACSKRRRKDTKG